MALPSINDKNFISAPITLNRVNNRNNNTSELIQLRREVAFIDREINVHENYVSLTKQLIAGNKELIKLHQEQKENINKRIVVYQDTNKKLVSLFDNKHAQLQDLLDGKKPVRSKSVQPVQTSKLEEVNTLPKGTLISEQKAKLESDVKKHNIAIEYHNNKLDKLTNTDKAKGITATTKPSKKEGLATGYKPTNHITTFKADNKSDIVKSSSSYVSNFSSQQQRYIAQSQTNIWDSIVTANIRKLI
jgi:hypothetical protein